MKNLRNHSFAASKTLCNWNAIVGRITTLIAGGLLSMVFCNHSISQVIVNEDFESYADTTAMDLKWDNLGTGVGVLVTTNGNSGNSAYHISATSSGATVNQWKGSAFSIAPSLTEKIVLRADIFNIGGTDGRETIGLRVGTDIFEMGHYNASPVLQQFGIRVNSIYSNAGYLGFANPTETLGWNRFEAIFTTTEVTVTLDLGADGSVDYTIVSSGAPGFIAFNDLRFGGPSGNSSVEPAWFDNIYMAVEAVPEPSTAALLGISICALIGIRRSRN